MRKLFITAGTVAFLAIATPAHAMIESGFGFTGTTQATVVQPVVQVTPQPVSQPVVQPIAPPPTPTPTLVEQVAPDGTVYYDPAPVPEPVQPVQTVGEYNPECNAAFDNLPCDWTSPHFATQVNTPEDIEWIRFFEKLEAGLADGTYTYDPEQFQFKDQAGNVVW